MVNESSLFMHVPPGALPQSQLPLPSPLSLASCKHDPAMEVDSRGYLTAAPRECEASGYGVPLNAELKQWIDSCGSRRACRGYREYDEMLSTLASGGDFESCVKLVKVMKQREMQIRRSTINSVIAACATAGRPLDAEHWLRQLLQMGYVPNRATYCSLVIAWAKALDLPRAEAWVKALKLAGFEIPKSLNRPIIHTLLDANTVKNPKGHKSDLYQVDTAIRWLMRVHKLGAPLESSTLNLILFAYARCGEHAKTEQIASFMHSSRIVPNRSTFYALITACVVAGKMERAHQWADRMEKFGFQRADPVAALEEVTSATILEDDSDVATTARVGSGDLDDLEAYDDEGAYTQDVGSTESPYTSMWRASVAGDSAPLGYDSQSLRCVLMSYELPDATFEGWTTSL